MSHKIGVLGNDNSVLIYRMLGFDVYQTADDEEASRKIDELAQDDYGVIYVTESVAENILETIHRYDDEILPAIILIPDHSGTRGIGKQRVQDNVEKAVGQDIL